MKKAITQLALTALLLGAGVLSHAGAALNGVVGTAEGKPIAGAMVTVWNTEKNRKETVYTDAGGRYAIDTSFTGKLAVRVRTPYFRDMTKDVNLTEKQNLKLDFGVEKIMSIEELSDTLPASAHNAVLPFGDDKLKKTFISQCAYCHQQGNSLTRRPRDEKEWSKVVRRMEGYTALLTWRETQSITQLLNNGFTGKPVKAIQVNDFSPEQSKARIEEWHAATPMSFLHDTIVLSDDKLMGIDEGRDEVYILDRPSGKIDIYKMPVTDEKEGGNFNGIELPIGIFTGKHGPHSGVQISDGRVFFTGALSSNLLMFQPTTKEWKLYPIPRGFLWHKGLYSHTIRADKDENLWFTMLASNMVLRFDTHTGQFTEVTLPHNGVMRGITDYFFGLMLKIAGLWPKGNLHLALSHHKWLNGGRDIMNWPYGIDINPKDGGIWYSKLLANKIGHIDPKTLQVTEYDVPHKGPRRMRFDSNGILWIPSFDEGYLMRFDPATQQFESTPLPLLAANEFELPYALNVDKHGDVWIATNNSDRITRYIPKDKEFVMYPMPHRVIWFRDFEFTQDGKVCASNSNLPAYAHEDQMPAFFCLQPDKASTESLIPEHQAQHINKLNKLNNPNKAH
ncbi:carboxypeptidase regulatory-like domain-containing protein [Candidatus Aalborgicola defluviihabitans]|uniref:carboxypeptidase regulatory-like domain-containing protein n=1 Tax=Candidatus Aalborgicola defluviihabitans TaxID=3386187 RepID=UPI001EBDC495|nr:carboxypeptidase regulatory-like domain-containing protein [Burkholderiales bacterium]